MDREDVVQYSRIEAAIAEAVKVLPKNFFARHEHGKRCYRVLKHILYPSEYTIIEAKQSRLRAASPARIIATNQRIIIVRPSFWALNVGHNIFSPTRYVSIPYSNIINIMLYTGMKLSTLDINLSMSTNIAGEIEGLKTGDARAIFVFLERMTECLRKNADASLSGADYPKSKTVQELNYIDMGMAKSLVKNTGAKFVWLGIEPLDYVAGELGVRADSVMKTGLGELSHMGREELARFDGHIFLCYDGIFATHVSKFLKSNHKINSYVLVGGMEAQMGKRVRA
jgi:hypothetical protein